MSEFVATLAGPTQTGKKNRRLPAFDVLRACAAMLVFLFHYSGFAAPQSTGMVAVEFIAWLTQRLGSVGTNLLLLLSGFFMAQSVASGRFSYGRFVSMRLIRIYIPFVVVLLLAVAFGHFRPEYMRADTVAVSLSTFFRQLLLLPGLFPERPVLTVTWTISYIVAGYLVFPLVEFSLRHWTVRRRGRLMAWFAVTALVFAAGLLQGIPSIRFAYVPAGCLVYELQAETAWENARPGSLRTTMLVTGFYLLLRVLLDGRLLGTEWSPLTATAAFSATGLVSTSGLIVIALLVQRRYQWKENGRLLAYVVGFGRTGYSFYLLHGPAVKLFALIVFPVLAAMHSPAVVYWLVMPACWLFAAVLALLLYRLVERPCRKVFMHRLSGLPDAR